MNFVENMRKSRSNKRGCRNRQKGGAESYAYSFGGPVAPGAPYAAEVIRAPACQQATPGGFLNSVPQHGLPGMYGGRYTNTFEVVGSAGIPVMNPQSIGCEGARSNPLNQVGPSRITELAPSTVLPGPGVPYGTAMGPFTRVGGRRKGSRSKGSKRRKQRGGVGGVGSEFYIAPRAGYTFLPSDLAGGNGGGLADGQTPFALNVPYSSGDKPNPACGTTGGSRTRGSRSRRSKGSRTTGSRSNRRKNRSKSKRSNRSKRTRRH